MERDHKVIKIINGEEYSFHEGYNSIMRQEIKRMHKKKRRQIFKSELLLEAALKREMSCIYKDGPGH